MLVSLRGKRILEWTLFSILGLVLVVSGLLLYYQKTYSGKIYPNVKIAGIDVAGKTKKQAEYLVSKDLSIFVKQPLLLGSADKEISVTTEETGLVFDINSAVDRAYNVGRSNKFIPQLWFSVKAAFDDSVMNVPFKINKDVFDKFMAEKVPSLNAAPQNAALIIENGVINETQESPGQTVDTKDLADQIIILASNRNNKKVNRITLKTTSSAPDVTLSMLQNAKVQAEQFLAKKVTLSYETKTFSPNRAEIGKWLVVSNNNGVYAASLNDNAIKTYLNLISNDIDVKKKDKRINALDNSVIDPGQEGKYVNKDAALASIKSQISSNATIVVALTTTIEAPKEVKVFPAEGLVPGRFPGKYVDVDLAQQKLCMVEGNNILGCFIVSSGKPSMPTPTGTFAIQNKNPRQWSGRYGLWMPYWQAFSGDYGLHELPEWPSGYKEGQDHLGTPVSHGCVRLGVGDAATVYNWTEIGTPVYIHK